MLGVPATLRVGNCYDELSDGVDAAFICGLAYVELVRLGRADLDPIAAPVLRGERYGDRPVYYSDVIVRRDSPYHRFADLRGRSWSFNEPYSHSGYGVTLYRLVPDVARGPFILRLPKSAGIAPAFGGAVDYRRLSLENVASPFRVDFFALRVRAWCAAWAARD